MPLQQYTQYIPLSVVDLQLWMGSPSIYVYDCSNAGHIINFVKANPVSLFVPAPAAPAGPGAINGTERRDVGRHSFLLALSFC